MSDYFMEDFAKKRDSVLYFAYGSNMDPAQMHNRVGQWIGRTVACLENHQLIFNKNTGDDHYGYANVQPKKGTKLWGIIYEIEPELLDTLDSYQGVPNHYSRNLIEVKTLTGKAIQVNIYVANAEKISENLVPREEHLEHLLRADTKLQQLPANYMDFLRSFNKYNRNADRYFQDLATNIAEEKVFVYGTLKSNQRNNNQLHNLSFVKAKALNVTLHSGPFYPFARRCEDSTIKGELYSVTADTLKKLDQFEGHPNFYYREKVLVELEDGSNEEAWIYFCDDAFNNPQIAEGVWP